MKMKIKTLKDFSLKNKRVLVRVDFNVPLDEKGEILGDFRIQASLPTIEYLVREEVKVVLMSHLDRPGGKFVERLKMDKVQERLSEYLDLSITKSPAYYSKELENWTYKMSPGEILLLENLRFWPGEERNDEEFSRNLAKLGDIYINEAFASSHREHASIVGVPKFFQQKGIGLLFEKEIKALDRLLKKERKNFLVIVGGVKKSKVEFLKTILNKVDLVLTGGLIARQLPKELRENPKIILPEDVVSCSDLERPNSIEIKPFKEVDEKEFIPDLGPKTIKRYQRYIQKAEKIFWVGPLGYYEVDLFCRGTKMIGESILKNKNALSVVGGGNLLLALKKLGLRNKGFSHLSTGGSALLEYVSGKELPGLKVLENN